MGEIREKPLPRQRGLLAIFIFQFLEQSFSETMVLHLSKLFTQGWLVKSRYWSVGRESVTEAGVDQRRPMPSYFPLSRPHSLTCSPLTASRPFIPDHSCICRLYEIMMWPLFIRNLWQVNYILIMPSLTVTHICSISLPLCQTIHPFPLFLLWYLHILV